MGKVKALLLVYIIAILLGIISGVKIIFDCHLLGIILGFIIVLIGFYGLYSLIKLYNEIKKEINEKNY